MEPVCETRIDDLYKESSSINDLYRECPSRHEIIDFIINDFPQYYANEDYQTKLETINKHQTVNARLWRKDSVSQCKIEDMFFEKINEWILL